MPQRKRKAAPKKAKKRQRSGGFSLPAVNPKLKSAAKKALPFLAAAAFSAAAYNHRHGPSETIIHPFDRTYSEGFSY